MPSLKKKRTPNLLLIRVIFLIALDILVINLSAFWALYIRYEFDYAAMAASGFLDTLALFAIPNTLLTLALSGCCICTTVFGASPERMS